MSDSIVQNKYTTYSLAAVVVALLAYIYVHQKNMHMTMPNSETTSPSGGLKTQAVRWKNMQYQMKPKQSQFVLKNSQNAVTHFSESNNPFVGKIKGMQIDGTYNN